MTQQTIIKPVYDTQAGGWYGDEYYVYDDMEVA